MAVLCFAEPLVRDIRRKRGKQYSDEKKVSVVLKELRAEESVAASCRRKGMAESQYYSWSNGILETGKMRRTGDTEVSTEQMLEKRLLIKA